MYLTHVAVGKISKFLISVEMQLSAKAVHVKCSLMLINLLGHLELVFSMI